MSNRDDWNAEIYMMNADGTNQTRLTPAAGEDCCAAWSPDGSRVAFESRQDGNFEICAMNFNGTNQINLSQNAAYDGTPTWSPDGMKLAFRRPGTAACPRSTS